MLPVYWYLCVSRQITIHTYIHIHVCVVTVCAAQAANVNSELTTDWVSSIDDVCSDDSDCWQCAYCQTCFASIVLNRLTLVLEHNKRTEKHVVAVSTCMRPSIQLRSFSCV